MTIACVVGSIIPIDGVVPLSPNQMLPSGPDREPAEGGARIEARPELDDRLRERVDAADGRGRAAVHEPQAAVRADDDRGTGLAAHIEARAELADRVRARVDPPDCRRGALVGEPEIAVRAGHEPLLQVAARIQAGR